MHAQDRFFEMDFRRHVTAGRLSELFGEDDPRDRQVHPHDGLAPGRRAGAGAARAGHPGRARGLHRRGQRLPRRPHARRRSRWSTPCSGSAGSTTSPSSGPRSTRWPGSRRWRGTCAATWTTRSRGRCSRSSHDPEQVDELYPRYPYDAHQPIVGQGAVVDGVFEQDAEPGGPATRIRPAYTAGQRASGARPAVRSAAARTRSRPDAADGRRHRLQQLGGRRRAHRLGQAAAGQRPAPGHQRCPGIWYQMGLHCREVDADCPFDVSGFTFSGVPGRGDRPQPPTSPGDSPTSGPTSPTSTWRRSTGKT